MNQDRSLVSEDLEHDRFIFEQDGLVAELIYRRIGERLILVHTGVPSALGGKGIGGQLVAAAVDLARKESLTVIPQCPYARKWLERHREVAEGVRIQWPPDHVGSQSKANHD